MFHHDSSNVSGAQGAVVFELTAGWGGSGGLGCGGVDGIFRQIIVDLDLAVLEEREMFVPLAEGLAGKALGQVFAPGKEVVEPDFDLNENGQAVGLAFAADDAGVGAL